MKQCIRRPLKSALIQRDIISRSLSSSCRCSQQPSEIVEEDPPSAGPPIRRHHAKTGLGWSEPEIGIRRPFRSQQDGLNSAGQSRRRAPQNQTPEVGILIDGTLHNFSPVLLRDICECPSCIDASTQQKFFSTADIPLGIRARAVAQTNGGVSILWDQDLPGYDRGHTTEISSDVLRKLAQVGFADVPYTPGQQLLWDAAMFNEVADIDYEAYMQDDTVLHRALHQIHTHGLLFLSNVPESETSVSTIGERIGPIKNTFYGYTWDVRSVPEAKNVAYTSQDLGFHMDLLYMHQPPHLQLLHCIRSSAKGGASLFTDSHRAAQELFEQNTEAFTALSKIQATFHYNHPTSHLYRQQRPVFEMLPLKSGGASYNNLENLANHSRPAGGAPFNVMDYVANVSWSPPFQGPFSAPRTPRKDVEPSTPPLYYLNGAVNRWHTAAKEYSRLIHRPGGIHERLMRPGECVVFDNRRVLHARKAFEVGDAGTERWLRGAYLDKDPYVSKLRVLQKRFGDVVGPAAAFGKKMDGSDEYFEAASN